MCVLLCCLFGSRSGATWDLHRTAFWTPRHNFRALCDWQRDLIDRHLRPPLLAGVDFWNMVLMTKFVFARELPNLKVLLCLPCKIAFNLKFNSTKCYKKFSSVNIDSLCAETGQRCSLNISLSSWRERALINTQPQHGVECHGGRTSCRVQVSTSVWAEEESLGNSVFWKPKKLQCWKGRNGGYLCCQEFR